MKRLAIYVVSLAVMVGATFTVSAQTASTGKTTADQKFMTKAAEGGMAEVALGRLASEHGGSDAVKQFGQRMVTDHGKANDELTQLAQQKGVSLPTAPDAKDQKLIDRLSKLSGADFDRAYMRAMVRDHNKDVKEFQREAQRGKDADVQSWASKTLPTLQEHQQQAKQLVATVKGKGGSRAARQSSSTEGGSASPSDTGREQSKY